MAIKNFNIQHGLSLGDALITIVDDNANVYASTLTVTENSTLGNLATANYFSGDGGYLSNITATSGSSATVTATNQPNITSLGNLVNLRIGNSTSGPAGANGIVYFNGNGDASLSGNVTVSGDANIQGNLTVGGMLTYIDSTKISLVDPILELGGDIEGAILSSNDALDRGSLLHYYTTKPMDAFMGWKNSDGQFIFGGNVTEASGTVTVNQYANVKAANYLGNLIGDQANLSNVNFTNNVTGGNLVSANYFTGVLTTNAQPNITSVGTLTGLTIAGKTDLSTVSNIKITGGTTGQYLQTDGSGNLSWVTISNITIGSGTSNVTVNNDGNVTLSSNGNANVIIVNGNAVSVNGTLTISNTTTTNALTVSSVIDSTSYSTGALTVAGGLGVAGNIFTNNNLTVIGDTFVNNTTVQGTSILQGTAEFQNTVTLQGVTESTNSSTGVLVLTTGGLGVAGNINSGQGISGVTLTGSLTTNAQPNITSVGTLTGLVMEGDITASGASPAPSLSGFSSVSAVTLTGTLTTNAQPNITSVGTLLNLSVAGNITTGNLSVSGKANLGSVANITITGGTDGQYLQTDGAGNVSWHTVSTSTLVNGTSNIVINPSGNVNISANSALNVLAISNNQVSVTPTTESTSWNTGALLVNGGVGIAGNVFINEILNVSGNSQFGNLNTTGSVEHTGEVSFTQITYFSNVVSSTNTTTGAVQITGGIGVQGNIFGGNIISAETTILRNGRNVPTFVTSSTMPTNPLLGDEWYDQDDDRIYQYIYDGTNYNWVEVSSGYIAANVAAQAGTLVVRDSNGNVYANTVSANNLEVANLTITGTTNISSMVTATSGVSVSNTIDTVIDSFPITSYRSAKYIISARNDDGYEVMEALVIHDNSISFIQTYGDISISPNDVADIVTLSSNIVGGNVRLYATGSNSNTFVNLISTYVTD